MTINKKEDESMHKATISQHEGFIKWFGLVVSVAALLLFGAANGVAKEGRACDADVAKLCKDVPPGGGRIVQCLHEHEKDVSPACKQEMAGMESKVREFMDSCKAEVQKYCQDVTPGEGRIIQCLKGHEGQLSARCKGSLPPPPPPQR